MKDNRQQSAPIAQLDRVPGFEPGCRGFESLWARHLRYRLAKRNATACRQFTLLRSTLLRLRLLRSTQASSIHATTIHVHVHATFTAARPGLRAPDCAPRAAHPGLRASEAKGFNSQQSPFADNVHEEKELVPVYHILAQSTPGQQEEQGTCSVQGSHNHHRRLQTL